MFGIWTIIVALGAYLLGAIPFGVVVARTVEKDLTKSGSGNTGAANAFRSLGIKGGAIVLAADVLKGTVACLLAYVSLVPGFALPATKAALGLLAVLGHNYSVFRGFKGGKGVATTFGVVLALNPKVALLGGLVWISCVALTKYPSVGSLSAVTAMPLLMALEGGDISSILFCAVAAGFAFFRHKANIERLKQGRELRYDERA
jgi:acyl phosphate:glycerol-3-phosphate acyltransferase